MVPRPLQKLGGDFPLVSTVGDKEFDSNLSYLLILIKACSILVYTHFTWFFCPFDPGC